MWRGNVNVWAGISKTINKLKLNIMIQLPKEVDELVKEYNTLKKMNSFFANNNDCNELLSKLLNGKDRWEFVYRLRDIEDELIPFAHSLHGKQVIVKSENSISSYKGLGIIEHELKREYNGRIHDNCVSMRNNHDGKGEQIALWVNTGDRFSTHLYTIDQLILVEELITT